MSLYKYEFPNYDGDFFIPNNWLDGSYHNDVCPHAFIRSKDETIEFRLWQDYIDIDLREYDNGKRYTFEIIVNESTVYEYSSDDLDEVKKIIDSVDIETYKVN